MKSELLKGLATSLLAVVFFVGGFALFFKAMETPIVQISHSTGQCVQVMPVDAGTCEELPNRYETEWVL